MFQGVGLLDDPAVVAIEVHRTQHRPVTVCRPQGGNGGLEVGQGHLPENLLSKVGRHRAHLLCDVGIVVGEVAVAGGGVYNTQGMAGLAEIVVHPLHNGISGVVEVDKHRAPHRGAHLVHQAAGLAEVDIFGVLADLGDGDGVQLIFTAEVVKDVAHQGLVGGGGGEAGTRQDG